MKKLILSAVFALACFTAQAKNEVVSNDDKNPKSKKETPKVKHCCVTFTEGFACDGVATITAATSCASTCHLAAMIAMFEVYNDPC